MDKRGEISNRWFRIFEHTDVALQKTALSKISQEVLISDFRYLFKAVKDLEQQLANAQNPYSSSIGQVVQWKDGILCYMLNGRYIPVQDIISGLLLLLDLEKKQKSSTKTQKEIFDLIKKGLGYEDKEKDKTD